MRRGVRTTSVVRVGIALTLVTGLLMSVSSSALAWPSWRDYRCMVRANAYAADSHPGLTAEEAQARIDWLYAQCAENRAVEAIAEEHGAMAPELFPNTEDDRHAHPLHCLDVSDNRFGMHTEWNSPNPPDDPNGPGGAAAINIPGDFMYAWIDGKARFFIRYVVWTIDDRNGDPVTPVSINQHPTENHQPQQTVAIVPFADAYVPTSIWAEMPDSIDWANPVNDRVLPGRSFAVRAWMESHCHDKRYKTNIPQMVIDHVKNLGWRNPEATEQAPRALRFVATGDPNQASSWSIVEESVTLPSQIYTKNIFRWFYDDGVAYASDDDVRPTKPLGLTAEVRSATRVKLTWEASTDNVGVAGYRIFKNGVRIGYTTSLRYVAKNLMPETEYRFKVKAVDEAGNVSPRSRIVRATTFADTSRPSRPRQLVATPTSDAIYLDWNPASDNVGISHYIVRLNGALQGKPTETSWVIEGLDPQTEYTVVVRAVDTSGNRSRRAKRLVTTLGAFDNYDAIAAGHIWRYLDDGSDLGANWSSVGFDDSSWATGVGEFGYGDGDEATQVNDGPDSNRHITTYFRTDFVVLDAATVGELRLRLVRDDGAVVYINGVEVFRSNMPGGTIDSETLASSGVSGDGESNWIVTALPTDSLVTGSNVMAVEIHQVHRSSSDISFNAELAVNP